MRAPEQGPRDLPGRDGVKDAMTEIEDVTHHFRVACLLPPFDAATKPRRLHEVLFDVPECGFHPTGSDRVPLPPGGEPGALAHLHTHARVTKTPCYGPGPPCGRAAPIGSRVRDRIPMPTRACRAYHSAMAYVPPR